MLVPLPLPPPLPLPLPPTPTLTLTLTLTRTLSRWGLPTERGSHAGEAEAGVDGGVDGVPYASPYARHEVFFLPTPHRGDAPLEFGVSVARGRIHLEF